MKKLGKIVKDTQANVEVFGPNCDTYYCACYGNGGVDATEIIANSGSYEK